MSAVLRSNEGKSFSAFESETFPIHYGYGIDALDFSRRLTSESRDAVIDILSRLEMLIGRANEGCEENWATNWKILRDNVIALNSSDEAECVANLFGNLKFLSPSSEVREMHH